jgi:pimeloyl-ACP methyl ester carboxylesterase
MGHNRLRPISGFPGGAAIRFYPASLFVGQRPRPDRPGSPGPVPAVRLARHRIVLDDGLVVGVSVAGRGLPLVVAHGFAAEGLLYTQTLSRLVAQGFKVVAVDMAGHGLTGLPAFPCVDLRAYSEILGRTIDRLGIRRAVLLGHSMGGRLVADLAASRPELAIAVLPVNAALGRAWDRQVTRLWRSLPVAGPALLARLAADTATTVAITDAAQAGKLLSLMLRTAAGTIRPHKLLAPAVALVMANDSGPTLLGLARGGVPVIVLHGDGDLAVPLAAARDVARRTGGSLVTVRGGRHCWLLRDPEALPAIFAELMRGPLGEARAAALTRLGLQPDAAPADVERALLEPDALARSLTPTLQVTGGVVGRRPPSFVWTVESP